MGDMVVGLSKTNGEAMVLFTAGPSDRLPPRHFMGDDPVPPETLTASSPCSNETPLAKEFAVLLPNVMVPMPRLMSAPVVVIGPGPLNS